MENENPIEVSADSTGTEAPKRKRAPRRATSTKAEAAAAAAAATESSAPAAESAPAKESAAGAEAASTDAAPAEGATRAPRGRGRGRGRGKAADATDAPTESIDSTDAAADNAEQNEQNGDGSESGRPRRERNRRRGRGRDDEFDGEVSDDDVLIPVAGILDILDNYAFVRTGGYLASPADVYVALGQVKKYGLRKGDAVVGAIRQPQGGDFQNRQKYNALATVDFINGASPEAALAREDFADGTPVYASETIGLSGRFASVKRGERVLVDVPAGATRTAVLRDLAAEISSASPDSHLMVVVADGQPEDVTALTRGVRGEVSASTYDRHADEHITVADLAIARAKRLVEQGLHVIVVVDSLTRVAKAQLSVIQGTRPLGDGSVDTAVFAATKRLFGAGRSLETGGSLTVIAAVDTIDHGFAGAVRDELADIATSVVAL